MKTWGRDAAERILSTYVMAFLGLLMASGTLDVSVLKAAAVAAIPAGLSAVKAVVATNVGDPASASLVKGV